MATNEETIQAFFDEGTEEVRSENLFYQNGILYSYGLHWPLIVMLDDSTYVVNRTQRSIASTKHRNMATNALNDRDKVWRFAEIDEIKQIIAQREALNG